jgi:hypothetical protein
MADKKAPGGPLPGQTGTGPKGAAAPGKESKPVTPNKDFKGGGGKK